MTDEFDVSKRSLLTGALAVGAGPPVLAGGSQDATAQLLESGIDPKSVLSKVKKGGALEVGHAQLPLWGLKDAQSGELRGIYTDLVGCPAQALARMTRG